MLTQKQHAIIVIALANFAREASGMTGAPPTFEQATTYRDALESVRPTAMILTDPEMLELTTATMKEVLAMPFTDIKIMPDSASIPLQ